MSLDMYASRSQDDIVLTPEAEAAFAQLKVHVHAWDGTGSFGARRYIELVDRVARVVLGYRWIPPDDVARESAADTYPATADQVRGLAPAPPSLRDARTWPPGDVTG